MKTKEAKPFLTFSKLNALPEMAKPNAKLKLVKYFILELPNCLGSSQFASYPQFSNSKFCQIINKFENPKIGLIQFYFWNQAKPSKNSI